MNKPKRKKWKCIIVNGSFEVGLTQKDIDDFVSEFKKKKKITGEVEIIFEE